MLAMGRIQFLASPSPSPSPSKSPLVYVSWGGLLSIRTPLPPACSDPRSQALGSLLGAGARAKPTRVASELPTQADEAQRVSLVCLGEAAVMEGPHFSVAGDLAPGTVEVREVGKGQGLPAGQLPAEMRSLLGVLPAVGALTPAPAGHRVPHFAVPGGLQLALAVRVGACQSQGDLEPWGSKRCGSGCEGPSVGDPSQPSLHWVPTPSRAACLDPRGHWRDFPGTGAVS